MDRIAAPGEIGLAPGRCRLQLLYNRVLTARSRPRRRAAL